MQNHINLNEYDEKECRPLTLDVARLEARVRPPLLLGGQAQPSARPLPLWEAAATPMWRPFPCCLNLGQRVGGRVDRQDATRDRRQA